MYLFFGSRTFVPFSWMCKKQASVSHWSTESEIISFDAGLRLDGSPALNLWDVVIEVLRSSNSTKPPTNPAAGNCSRKTEMLINCRMWTALPQTHFHRLTIMNRHLTLCLPEERIDLWMKFTTTKSKSDPAQNYFLHFRIQKGENLEWKNPIIATRKRALAMSQVDMATRKLVQTISAVLPIIHLCSKKAIIPPNERKWWSFSASSSCGDAFSKAVSEMLTRMVRRCDQEEREPDGSYHWDTVNCCRRLENMEHNISQKNIGFSSFKKEAARKELNTVYHKNSLAYVRAIQGQSGGIPFLTTVKEYVFHRGCSWNVQSILGSGLIPGGKESDKARQAVFFTPLNPFGENPDEEEPHDDYTVPQKVHYHSHWKRNQDAVYWIFFLSKAHVSTRTHNLHSFQLCRSCQLSYACLISTRSTDSSCTLTRWLKDRLSAKVIHAQKHLKHTLAFPHGSGAWWPAGARSSAHSRAHRGCACSSDYGGNCRDGQSCFSGANS